MPRRVVKPFALALAATCAQAGPITFNTALPVSSGQFIFRQSLMFLRAQDDPTPMNRDLRVLMAPTVLIYGLTPVWTLMGALPTMELRMDLDTPTGRVRREARGVGDLWLAARYTALAIDRPEETLRLAPLVGLKFPTGAEHKGDAFGPLPPSMQPGSGSWDPGGGAILSWQTLKWELDLSATYQRRNKAHGFKAGDEARLEGSFQYRAWHGHDRDGGPTYLYAVLETNAVWRGQNRLDGVVDPHTGGTSIFLAPGLQWVTRRIILEAAYQVPLRQRLHGLALRGDSTLHLGVRFNF